MKVILLQDISNIGKKWDIKDVSSGYASNFLLPKKLVEVADNSSLKKIERLRENEIQSQKENLEKTQELAEQLQGKEVVINAKEKDGKLFGSISPKDIAKALKKDNIDLPVSSIKLENPIKETGEHEVKLELEHGIEVRLSVMVEGIK